MRFNELPNRRIVLRGIFDIDHVAQVVAGAIAEEIERVYGLDADLLLAEREISRLWQQLQEAMPAKDTLTHSGLLDALDRVDATLIHTPARSMAKLRRMTAFFDGGHTRRIQKYWRSPMSSSAEATQIYNQKMKMFGAEPQAAFEARSELERVWVRA